MTRTVHQMPNGELTTNLEQYARAWMEAGKKLEGILGAKLIGVDPEFVFENGNRLSRHVGMRLVGQIKSTDCFDIYEELKSGGDWLGAARTWMQNNFIRGDSIIWGDQQTQLQISPAKLEDFAFTVARHAVSSDRRKK